MSLSVLNNISAIYAQNNLNQTQNSLQKTLQQLSSGSRMWSGAFVCPASKCGSSHAAGLYGDARIGSKSAWRARSAPKHTGFPDPVF